MMWFRRIGLGLGLACLLVVLLAWAVNDLIPGTSGGIIGSPEPAPTLTLFPGATATSEPGVTAAPTDTTGGGGGEDSGTEGGTGGNTGSTGAGGGGGGSGGGGGGGGGALPPRTYPPTPTAPAPPTFPPPTTGPKQCTVQYVYCVNRQLIFVSVRPGRLALANGVSGVQFGSSASLVRLSAPTVSTGASLGGGLTPVTVTDTRGVDTGWTLSTTVSLPGGVPKGVLISVTPWCVPVDPNSAPGIVVGGANQNLSGGPVTLCTKTGEKGAGGSTSGVYQVGADITVTAWRGDPIPVSALLMSLNLS